MPRSGWENVILCHTGDFDNKNHKIRQWVEYHGGQVLTSINPEVTHLVASPRAWKAGHKLITKAKELDTIEIVTLEWLEDSLTSRKGRPKPTSSRYRWEHIDSVIKSKAAQKAIARAEKVRKRLIQFDKECEELARELGQDGYHLYTDPTAFTYSITLARPDLLTNQIDRYHIKVRHHSSPDTPIPVPVYFLSTSQVRPMVFLDPECDRPSSSQPIRVPIVRPLAQQLQVVESDSLPPSYGLLVRYTCPAKKKTIEQNPVHHKFSTTPPTTIGGTDLLCPLGSSWDFVFSQFRWFFKKKTGIDWELRAAGLRGPDMFENGKDSFDIDEETGLKTSRWFRYTGPPVREISGSGLMPDGESEGKRDATVPVPTTGYKNNAGMAKEKTKKKVADITVMMPVTRRQYTTGQRSFDLITPARTPEGGW